MKRNRLAQLVDSSFENISYVIKNVGKRGATETENDADDFHELLQRKEFQALVVGELYESYFLPERHEFDWQVLSELVRIMFSERVREFVALALAGGVIGNGATMALVAVLRRVIAERKKAGLRSRGEDPFVAMNRDAKRIDLFFRERRFAHISDVEAATGVARERIYPILKLTGFKHYRRRHACHWCPPGTLEPGSA